MDPLQAFVTIILAAWAGWFAWLAWQNKENG